MKSKTILFIILFFTIGLYAVKLVGGKFKIFPDLIASGGGKISSSKNKIEHSVIGEKFVGVVKNTAYIHKAGYIHQVQPLLNPPAKNLKDVYVYPNPFKPNSPSSKFYSDKITFKKLPKKAKIKIYTITGELVVTLNKTDETVDYYKWEAKNESGEKLASGVYIYYIEAEGEKAKGKFAIIR